MMRWLSSHLPLLMLMLVSAALSPTVLAAESEIVASLTELATDKADCSQKADIFFALDSSHSVGRANFGLVRNFIAEIVTRLLSRSTNFQFGVVIFSDKADMVVKLKDYAMNKPKERQALLKFLQQDLTYKSGKTATGEAFQLIRELGFRQENGRRPDARPIVVLLTDGRANGRVNAVTESARLRGSEVGASVLAIGVGSGVSRAALELLAGGPKRVTLVSGFEDLGKVSQLVSSVLCGGGSVSAAEKKSGKTCGVGLQLIAGVCVPVKPRCRRLCPKGFLLVHPCTCTPDVAVGSDCVKSCRESEILVRGCRCVPRHVPSKPVRPKVCRKACPEGKRLNAARCKCECKSKCPGPNFSQAAEDCSCACSMRCRPGLALNKKTCDCQRVDCPPNFEYFNGRCRHIVRHLCPAGQILFRDVCRRGHSCPKGYELRRDRKCYKVGCDPGFKRTKDGGCKKMCSGKRYYFNRRCHEPMTCGKRKYFRVNASGCPRTCAEPVRLTRCPKEREPACVCQPYYLLLNGKCVHPSDCPNVPICIEKADVIFMLDSSLTVTEHNFYMMKNFVRDVVQQFYLRTGTRQRVGVMRFNHRADIIMDLDSWRRRSHEDIQKQIEAVEYQPGLTFLGEALHAVRTRMWRRRAGMRSDVPRVTILLTDGTDTNGQVDQYYEAEKLRELGVFFVTIAMGDQIGVGENRRSLEKLAGPEGRVFIFGLREFQDIHGLVSRVLSFHCERPLCPHPYLIYGDCIGDYKSISRVEYVSENFRCKKTIRHDFKRIRCACPKPEVKEGPCVKMFRKLTRAVYTLDKKAGICKGKFKDSKAQCACPTDKVVESRCVNYKRTVATTAYTLVRAGSDPASAKCKPKVTKKTMRCASGYITLKYTLIDEPPVLKKLVQNNLAKVTNLMTESLAEALKLKQYQVANMKLDADLHGSCKVPYKAAHPFAVLVKSDTFHFLWQKSKFKFNPKSVKVILPACPKPVRKEGPCLHNFKLIHETLFKFEHKSLTCAKIKRTKELRCSCPKPQVETAHCNGRIVPIKVYEQRVNEHNGCDDILWTGSARCSRSCSKRTDIAFIIDSSDSVRGANFEYIRRFVAAVAKKLDVSRDNTHVAVLKYSSVEQMKVVFNFVAHYNLKSMTQRVMEMRYSPGSTYTGDALLNFRRFLLNSVNGYRGGSSAGVESVVVLVTDGASNSAIDAVKEASKIKALGCSIVTVGVGDDVQSKELEKIASDPAAIHSFKTDSFRELVDPTFVESVVTATCRVGKVNKVAVKQQLTNKIRDLMARNVELNFAELGLKKFDPKDLARFEFRFKGTYVAVVGATLLAKAAFLSRVRNVLAEAVSLHPFSIRKLQVSRSLVVSGQVSAAKLDRLRSLVKADKLKFGWRGAQLKIDKKSFAVLSPASLQSVRLAATSADLATGVARPLGRLLTAARLAAQRIPRADARRLAVREVADLSRLVEKSGKAVDELAELAAKARRTADTDAAKSCLKRLKLVLSSADRLARHAMYIAYFSPKTERDQIEHRHDRVAERIAAAAARVKDALTAQLAGKGDEKKEKKAKKKEEKEKKEKKEEKKEKKEKKKAKKEEKKAKKAKKEEKKAKKEAKKDKKSKTRK